MYPPLLRVLVTCLVAWGTWALPVPVVAAESAEQDRIDALVTLSQSEPASAILQLQSLGQTFTESTPAVVRREFWMALIGLQIDLGVVEPARASLAQFVAWAKSHQDEPGRLLAGSLNAALLVHTGQVNGGYNQLLALEQPAVQSGDSLVQWAVQDQLGKSRRELGKLELAVGSFLKALPHADKLQRGAALAKLQSLEGLSNTYASMHNWSKALEINQAAMEIAQTLETPRKLASLLLNRGVIYGGMGADADAEKVTTRSAQIAREAGLTYTLATALNNLADARLRRRDYPAAERLGQESLELYKVVSHASGQATAKVNIGLARMGQRKIAQGSADVQSALEVFRQLDAVADEEGVLAELSQMYERLGMTTEALATVRQQQSAASKLFQVERERAVANAQEVFDSAARQQRIESLAHDNNLKDLEIRAQRIYQIVIFIGGLIAASVALFAFHLYRRGKAANDLLHQLNLQLEFHSIRDPLTGLFNRRYFLELMDRRIVDDPRLRHNDDLPDGFVLIDVDGFKQINDAYGHSVGDFALVEVAHRLRRAVRDTDTLVRWGGEEFLVYSPHSSAEHLRLLTQRILDSIGSTPMALGGRPLRVTVSAGFVTLPFDDLPEQVFSWERAVRLADLAMYQAKQTGRNRAYGLVSLAEPKAESLSALEHHFDARWQTHLQQWHELLGPAAPDTDVSKVSTAPEPTVRSSSGGAG